MDAWSRAVTAALICLLIVAVLVWWWRRRAKPYGSAPAHTSDATWWLVQEMLKLAPGSQCGGTYANKPGYHDYRNGLDPRDYSVVDEVDQLGPGDLCAAIDWTFPDAQRGDYSTIALYTKRLIDSGKDPDDPRLNGWREVYGNADDDTYVEGYDFRYQCDVTSDSSHLWHIHLSETRQFAADYENKRALLSVLRGETVEQWLGKTMGDGAVILNCPFDDDRLDVFYVDPNGAVAHHWYRGGMAALWSGDGSSESLGGVIVPGTLSAAWDPQGTLVNIIGLGAPDDDDVPNGAGQYWGSTLTKTGTRSGWGSLPDVYGQLPAAAVRGHRIERVPSEWRRPGTWILLAGVLLIAASLASIWIR